MFERLGSLAAMGLACAGLALSCSSAPLNDEETGTVAVELVTDQADGMRCQLQGTFVITGLGRTITLDASGHAPFIRQALPSGNYSIELQRGYAIACRGPTSQDFVPVDTVLASPNPQPLSIVRATETSSRWQFLLRAQTGDVGVSFDVATSSALLGSFLPDSGSASDVNGGQPYDFETYFVVTPGRAVRRVTNTQLVKSRSYHFESSALIWLGEEHPILAGLSGSFEISANYEQSFVRPATNDAAQPSLDFELSSVTWTGITLAGRGSAPAPASTGLGELVEEGWTVDASEISAPRSIDASDLSSAARGSEGRPSFPALDSDGFPPENIEFSAIARSNRYSVEVTGKRVEANGWASFNFGSHLHRLICTPNGYLCQGLFSNKCNSSGTAFTLSVNCFLTAGRACNLHTGTCEPCLPHVTSCSVDRRFQVRCNPDGTGPSAITDCLAVYGVLCHPETGGCKLCVPHLKSCMADGVTSRTCNSDGTSYNSYTNCQLNYGTNCNPATGTCDM